MKTERRMLFVESARAQLEEREGQTPKIVGLASVYYDGTRATEYELWEGVWERIMPGAFDKVLGNDVRGLFNHDPSAILGRTTAKTMTLSSTPAGLRYEIQPGNTTMAKDVMEHLRRGDVTGSSFSFTIEKEAWTKRDDGTEIREILAVGQLYDVGPVTYPAYEATSAGVRSGGAMDEARSSHEMWRKQVGAKLAQAQARARTLNL